MNLSSDTAAYPPGLYDRDDFHTLSQEKSKYLGALSIAFYAAAALAALGGCLPFVHLAIGAMTVAGAFGGASLGVPEMAFGCFFIVIALMVIGAMWTYAYFMAAAAKALKKRERHLLCVVMAGVSCTFAPIGTALGVLALILLLDPEVRTAFGAESGRAASAP
ncbi:MAG: hypothetical protein AAF725_09795 [Acidobacteriota bacterium]